MKKNKDDPQHKERLEGEYSHCRGAEMKWRERAEAEPELWEEEEYLRELSRLSQQRAAVGKKLNRELI